MITKYGDDIVDVISSLPESEKKEALELINTYGDDALNMIESNQSVEYVEVYCKAKNGNLKVSRNKVNHAIKEHNPHKVAEQLKYNGGKIRSNATYFNKEWSNTKIEEAINYGYNEAIKQRKWTGEFEFVYDGEIVTICTEKGGFKTGYGNYVYSVEELIDLLGD